MTSPFKKRYQELVRTSHENPSMGNAIRAGRAWVERNRVLNDLARQVLYYGFTERELKKAMQSARDDAQFDRKYGMPERQI